MINGKTKLLCLLGTPVAHSFSPIMHNAAFNKLGINASYMAFDIPTSDLQKSIDGLKVMGFVGANVTSPHKLEIMQYLDHIDENAQLIGAVNTIVNREGILYGYNTDYLGFIEALKIRNVDLENIRVAILGTGGAAQASIVGLLNENVGIIDIFSRHVNKGQELIEKLNNNEKLSALEYDTIYSKSYDLVINATPLGMHPYEGISPIEVDKVGEDKTIFYDLIYNPSESEFLRQARVSKRITLNGLDMLIYQGIYALKFWFDGLIDEELWNQKTVLEILKEANII